MTPPIFAALLLGLLPSVPARQEQSPGAADTKRFVGTWRGSLDAGGRSLTFLFHLRLGAEGLSGSLDSPDEKLFGLAIAETLLDGRGGIDLGLTVVGGRYVARLDPEETALVGEWKQRGASIPLRCERGPLAVFEPVPGQDELIGSWEGVLETSGAELRLRFHLRDDGGRVAGTFDSVDQGALGLPLGSVELGPEGRVSLRLGVVAASFEGSLKDGRLVGSWKQGGSSIPLEFESIARPEKARRPQLPVPPFPYREEEVRYTSAGIELAGTLTLPGGAEDLGPFPAALLITGSGGQDRDETIFEHKPFLVLADALTRRGIAVLRVDDRGVGQSGGTLATVNTLDLAGDAEAGFDWLRQHPLLDAQRVGLIGHSEGGLIAPLIAARRKDVAFIVLLAGPGIRGDQILIQQAELIARAAGTTEERVALNRRLQERLFEWVASESISREELEARLLDELGKALEEEERPSDLEAFLRAQIESVDSPWMRYFLAHDPGPVLERVYCPLLALIGEKDLQVPAATNEPALRSALERARHPDFSVHVLPGLNHLFQPCETGGIAEYAQIETTFAPEALGLIEDWLREHLQRR